MSLDLLFHLSFFLVQRVTPVLLWVTGTIGVFLSLCLSLLGLHVIVPGGIVRAGGEHYTMETA